MTNGDSYEARKHIISPNQDKSKWGAFYLFIVDFFASQNIGGAKELVVLF